MHEISTQSKPSLAIAITKRTIFINLLLSALKLGAGLYARSAAMCSDAVHSLSDVFSSVIVILGIKLGHRKADASYPYGYERFESVAALLLAILLLLTGLGIGWAGIQTLLLGAPPTPPGKLALAAAVLSILIKEGMYHYTRAAAQRLRSTALLADAWHHRSDALSSVGSFLGILGARLGFPALDCIVCLFICALILKVALDIFQDAIQKMTDHACDTETQRQISAVALAQAQVLGIDELKTRLFGENIYVDLEIRADGTATLYDSHNTAHRVQDAILAQIPNVKHCMVHVNPSERA